MTTNPHAKTVLCYGDSNAWGQSDRKNVQGRYDAATRWTGKLQQLLGDDYSVIEEGLGGRTTNLDHVEASKQGQNGLSYFVPCVASHAPVDLVVIMLGTNDLKTAYNRTPEDIATALGEYVDVVREISKSAKILLISPIHINARAPLFEEFYADTYDEASERKSHMLAAEIERIAQERNVEFTDMSMVIQPGRDGIHMSKEAHEAFAVALYSKVLQII